MLTEETLPNGKLKRVPTENGISEGIRLNEYFTPGGFPGYAIMLSPAAQQFVLDNIDAIAEMNGLPREKRNRLPFEVTAYFHGEIRYGNRYNAEYQFLCR